MQEYCPASGKYDKNTAIDSSRTVGSLPTFLKDYNRK
jgi:hypothetical protein